MKKIGFRTPCILGGLLIGCTALGTWQLQAQPLDQDFQVNVVTTGDQESPDVAATADGGFVVVWQSLMPPKVGLSLNIQGRRYDASGQPLASEFQVNESTTFLKRRPRISSRDDGSYVVLWRGGAKGGKGTLSALEARAFDSAGTPVGGDFQVALAPNIYTYFSDQEVAASAPGELVVAMSDFYNNGQGQYFGSSRLRRLTDTGGLLDSVALGNSDGPHQVGLDFNPVDGFVVAWQESDYLGQYVETHARRFATDGTDIGSSIALYDSDDFTDSASAAVGWSQDGEFVTVWDGRDPFYLRDNDIHAIRVDAAGVPAPAGPTAFTANTSGRPTTAELAQGADGNFLVVWTRFDAPDDPEGSIRGRRLAPDGTPFGDEMHINSTTSGVQFQPRVASIDAGRRFIVVWTDLSGSDDADGRAVRARRVEFGLFVDGFESGSVAAWSNSVP